MKGKEWHPKGQRNILQRIFHSSWGFLKYVFRDRNYGGKEWKPKCHGKNVDVVIIAVVGLIGSTMMILGEGLIVMGAIIAGIAIVCLVALVVRELRRKKTAA